MEVNQVHEDKDTLSVAVNIPGHDPRVETPEYRRGRAEELLRDPTCVVCGSSEDLETHHCFVERCMTNMVDKDQLVGMLQWLNKSTEKAIEALKTMSVEEFVDSSANLMTLCHPHHLGKNEGIHTMDFPRWSAQWYGKEGYVYSYVETIHHKNKPQ